MSMEVSNNYAGYYNNTLSDSKKESKHTAEVKSNTSASSKGKVQEYYEKLCKKFPQITFNTNGGEMRCSSNKVVVNLSYDCLKKMANDPEFAKEIEWNLSGEVAANAKVYSFAKGYGVELGGRIVKYDANGNRTSACGGMRTANAGSGNNSAKKLQKKNNSVEERIRKKIEEQEEMEARRLEKRRQKEEFEERIAERRREREAYFDHIAESNGKLGQYQNSDVMQPTSYFDTNI